MECRLLTPTDHDTLYQTFKSAFSDHVVKLQPTREEFEKRLHDKLIMDKSLSAASFDGNQMIGFILHSSNVFQGVPTAYNGGTGILPGFRNQRLAEELYTFLIPKILSKCMTRVLLEVVASNESAIKLYEKIGFHFTRTFKCYRQTKKLSTAIDCTVERATIGEVDFRYGDFDPSFLDSEAHLADASEAVLVAREGDIMLGYLIFQPHIGRISQIAVRKDARQQGIGSALLLAAQNQSEKPLTIMNIPEDQHGMHTFLKVCGFKNEVNQFEMELIL